MILPKVGFGASCATPLAAVGHGLVERLELFERGLLAFLRGRAKVFVEPPVGRAPGVGGLFAQLLGEVVAQVRMRVEGMTNDE
jgi:hypothetical protein